MDRLLFMVGMRTSLWLAMFLSVLSFGCVARPLPHRPSIQELIDESLAKATSNYEIHESEYETEVHHEFWPLIDKDQALPSKIDFREPQSSGIMADGGETFAELIAPGDPDELTITEEFIETDVREVLNIIAEEFEIDLIVDEKVSGVVNTRLESQPLRRAIEKVLMPLGYHYAKRGELHYIGPADLESPLFSFIAERTEYRPRHLEAQTLLDTVTTPLKPFVQVVSNSNLIIVEAPSRIANQIIERFASIDQPIPQVILEAMICIVSPDSGFQFGLDWEHAVQFDGENALQLGVSGLALSSTYSGRGANAIFDNFAKTSTFVKLLSEHGYLTIRATPQVMAEDNKPANITINRETFFSVQPQTSTDGETNPFFFQQDIQAVNSGISLDITPRIRGDIVTIDITKAEVSEDVRNANTELSVNPFPIINRRSVSTTVHVRDGKTAVIGGLVQRETIDRVNRVPGLSKLPWLGYLFETTQRQTRDAEVVIFISPKIVAPIYAAH